MKTAGTNARIRQCGPRSFEPAHKIDNRMMFESKQCGSQEIIAQGGVDLIQTTVENLFKAHIVRVGPGSANLESVSWKGTSVDYNLGGSDFGIVQCKRAALR
jgi:hypothetical protein